MESPAFQARSEELKRKFIRYCRQLPVVGFNSSRYDLNLIKGSLFPQLGFGAQDEHSLVIRKNNSYTAVGATVLRFLDISNYVAPGFSYSQFLKAFGVEESKSYFPYEWFDDPVKLDFPALPPYEAFFSKLKQCNVLDEGEGKEAGRARHEELQNVWRERGMTSFRDFLVYYNNLDTGPMVVAIEKMQRFYFDRCIDLFKIAVSVPGIARHMLYKTAAQANVSFSSVRPGHEDLHYLIRKNIVGGPAIIFTRQHEAGKTMLRNDPSRPCTKILGYDANSLYLSNIDGYHPTGDYVRRFAPDFSPEFRGNRRDMFHWLDYVSLTENITIWHQRNHGEVKIGRYRVDGFQPGTKNVFEYDGCYVHGCPDCQLGPTAWREKKQTETRERREWLERNSYSVRVMKEHEFKRLIRTQPALESFVSDRLPPFYRRHRGASRTETILDAVRKGPEHFFGFLEVDIRVPDHLTEHFSEMCPIFTNTDIPFAEFGDFMQAHVRQYRLSERPRRLLVGGLSASRILLSSELLRWYLNHGLAVTKLYQVVEYVPVRCFRSFVREVTEARRAGDADPSTKVIADTWKLIGNSSYGSVIMDKEKFLNVKYYTDPWRAQEAVNSPNFRKLEEISDNLYEISSCKASLRLDLPIQIGFQILQLAKLRMLEFITIA